MHLSSPHLWSGIELHAWFFPYVSLLSLILYFCYHTSILLLLHFFLLIQAPQVDLHSCVQHLQTVTELQCYPYYWTSVMKYLLPFPLYPEMSL